MQICILSDSDLKEFDPTQYLRAYTWEMFIPQKPVTECVRRLADENHFEVYFNLCDGSEDEQEDYSGLDIVYALEALRLPFTGANSCFYDPSREEMQLTAEANGIRFARGVNIRDLDELNDLQGLRYPVVMEYDAEGHAGFLDRIFRAAPIRNKAQIKPTIKQECLLQNPI